MKASRRGFPAGSAASIAGVGASRAALPLKVTGARPNLFYALLDRPVSCRRELSLALLPITQGDAGKELPHLT